MSTHSLNFSTESPLEDAARALDMMRRMSFELCSFDIQQTAKHYMVNVIYLATGSHSPRVLDAQIEKMFGVFNYRSTCDFREIRDPKVVSFS